MKELNTIVVIQMQFNKKVQETLILLIEITTSVLLVLDKQ